MSQTVLETPVEDAVKDTDDAEGLTELEKIDPERVDGVGTPANGFPTLMLKSIPGGDGGGAVKSDGDPPQDDGDDEEDMDADDGDSEDYAEKETAAEPVADVLADATTGQRDAYKTACVEWRAREPLWKGRGDGTEYLQLRAKWQAWDHEGAAAGLNGTEEGARAWLAEYALRDDAVKAVSDAEKSAFTSLGIEKKSYTAEQRRDLARQGKALSDGSYPIADKEDLHNAYTLAASGHGNTSGAKRLISRRAKELGVANPFDSKDGSKKAAAPPAKGEDGKDCPTCKGDGKIKGGHVTCPDCKGKGTLPPGDGDSKKGEGVREDMVKAWNTLAEQYQISAGDAAALVEAMEKATRPLPSDVKPAGPHREPDGSSTVERLEPQAGLPTDRDSVKDKVPASVMGKEVPYAVKRMHDATCAAYNADDVLTEYPALKSLTEALDPALLPGDADAVGKAIGGLQAMDPAAVADGRALVHKAFTDMYPSAHCSPSSPPQPGSYHRPYLSAGHAAEHASGGANVPPSSHVPDPGQFHRGYLSAGHAADSPASAHTTRPVVTGASRANYASASKTFAEQSFKAIHDHLVSNYMEVCPMATGPAAPPDMGARNVPTPATPAVPGGVNTVKDDGKKARKQAKKMAAEVAKQLAAQGVVTDPEAIKALIDAQLATVKDTYETQISGLTKQVEELGAQPDPAMAPVRGQMARAVTGTAAPVEKRSLIDEAREREQAAIAKQAAEHADFIDYVRKTAQQSTNPQVRESAIAVLDQIGENAAKPA